MNIIRITIFLALTLMGNSAIAALTVSNWIATATTLDFDITGTIDPGVTLGPIQQNTLFVGPANLAQQIGSGSTTGTWTSLGGIVTAIADVTLYNDLAGVKLQIRKASNWAVGDTLNYHVSFSSPSMVDLSGFDISGAIVSSGRSDYVAAPEAVYQVGAFGPGPGPGPGPVSPTAVPTISTYGLIFTVMGLLIMAGRRLRTRR